MKLKLMQPMETPVTHTGRSVTQRREQGRFTPVFELRNAQGNVYQQGTSKEIREYCEGLGFVNIPA